MRNMRINFLGRMNWMKIMNLPFFREIKEQQILDKFIRPIMDKYSRKCDPMYMIQMQVKKASLALKCQDFHLALDGSAKQWYRKLPLGSIQSLP